MEALRDDELDRIEYAAEVAHGKMLPMESRDVLALVVELKRLRPEVSELKSLLEDDPQIDALTMDLAGAQATIDHMRKALDAAEELAKWADNQKYGDGGLFSKFREAMKEIEALA